MIPANQHLNDDGPGSAIGLATPPPDADAGAAIAADERIAVDPVAVARVAPPPRSAFRRVLQDRERLLEEIVRGERPALGRMTLLAIALTALGGLGLGIANAHPLQPLVAAVKAPMISIGALLVCFPALYVFGALQGSRVSVEQSLRIFAVGMGLRGAIIAGLAPLLIFFSVVGSPYGFLLLCGLLVFGAAEIGFLRTVDLGMKKQREAGDSVSSLFTRGWMVLYLGVAAQLTWSLRPHIGHPDVAWTLLGGPGGNMFTYFLKNVMELAG